MQPWSSLTASCPPLGVVWDLKIRREYAGGMSSLASWVREANQVPLFVVDEDVNFEVHGHLQLDERTMWPDMDELPSWGDQQNVALTVLPIITLT